MVLQLVTEAVHEARHGSWQAEQHLRDVGCYPRLELEREVQEQLAGRHGSHSARQYLHDTRHRLSPELMERERLETMAAHHD